MIRRLAIGVLFAASGIAGALASGGQAFSAVRAAQQVASTGSLIAISGERGEPQPASWTLVYNDQQARGGIREVEVANGAVLSQRTPLRGNSSQTSLAPIRIARLKVDSDAAFDIANKQARSRQMGFHWIDYAMRADGPDGTPVWVLKLYDYMGAQVGATEISAESGAVIVPLHATMVRNDETTPRNEESGQKVGGVIGTVTGVVERTAVTAKDATLRAVGTVQEVLTGERTIGPKDDN